MLIALCVAVGALLRVGDPAGAKQLAYVYFEVVEHSFVRPWQLRSSGTLGAPAVALQRPYLVVPIALPSAAERVEVLHPKLLAAVEGKCERAVPHVDLTFIRVDDDAFWEAAGCTDEAASLDAVLANPSCTAPLTDAPGELVRLDSALKLDVAQAQVHAPVVILTTGSRLNADVILGRKLSPEPQWDRGFFFQGGELVGVVLQKQLIGLQQQLHAVAAPNPALPVDWVATRNPSMQAYLQTDRGVLVRSSAHGSGLERGDLLVAIDGKAVTSEGLVMDPSGRLSLDEAVALTRDQPKLAIKVRRDGKELELDLPPPRPDPLLPLYASAAAADYFILGGLVFTPASMPLLKDLSGGDSMMFMMRPDLLDRLVSRHKEHPGEEILICTWALPSEENQWQTSGAAQVLHSINGHPTPNLETAVETLDRLFKENPPYLTVTYEAYIPSADGAARSLGVENPMPDVVFRTERLRALQPQVLASNGVPSAVSPRLCSRAGAFLDPVSAQFCQRVSASAPHAQGAPAPAAKELAPASAAKALKERKLVQGAKEQESGPVGSLLQVESADPLLGVYLSSFGSFAESTPPADSHIDQAIASRTDPADASHSTPAVETPAVPPAPSTGTATTAPVPPTGSTPPVPPTGSAATANTPAAPPPDPAAKPVEPPGPNAHPAGGPPLGAALDAFLNKPGDHDSGSLPLARVVKIFTTSVGPNFAEPWQIGRPQRSTGSGILIRADDGLGFALDVIITNAHVVEHAVQVVVQRPLGSRKMPAVVAAVAQDADLALLTVPKMCGNAPCPSEKGAAQTDPSFWADLPPLKAASVLPKLRDLVLVAGFPLEGDATSVTQGVVSRVTGMSYQFGIPREVLPSSPPLYAVQVDAAINPGNSGGPVFAPDGSLLGIAFAGMQQAHGVGYLIPMPVLRGVLPQLFERIARGIPAFAPVVSLLPEVGLVWRGLDAPPVREYVGLAPEETGVLVKTTSPLSVFKGSNELKHGDVLTHVDGFPIANNGMVVTQRDATDESRSLRVTWETVLTDKLGFQPTKLTVRSPVSPADPGTAQTLSPPRTIEVVFRPLPQLAPRCSEVDAHPQYVVIGGLVFTEFSMPLLQALPAPTLAKSTLLEALHQWKPSNDTQLVVLVGKLGSAANQFLDFPLLSRLRSVKVGSVDTPVDNMVGLVRLMEEIWTAKPDEFVELTFRKAEYADVGPGSHAAETGMPDAAFRVRDVADDAALLQRHAVGLPVRGVSWHASQYVDLRAEYCMAAMRAGKRGAQSPPTSLPLMCGEMIARLRQAQAQMQAGAQPGPQVTPEDREASPLERRGAPVLRVRSPSESREPE